MIRLNCILPLASVSLLILCSIKTAKGQVDSVQLLKEVVVTGFQNNRPLSEIPATVSSIGSADFSRFASFSLLPAINTVPGVRMEERSPGSYRFSIRGSLLRSPFGIRNVKFYLNGLPFTDGGGNTYLNLLDLGLISTLEIIKGPGASLFGAGTGGTVLLNSSLLKEPPHLTYSLQYGSFGAIRTHAGITLKPSKKHSLALRTSFQKADGYRQHSSMERLSSGIDWHYFISSRSTLSTTFLTSNLFYETPGGLTRTQWETDPTQARPTTGTNLGAVDRQASVKNITHYLSSLYEHSIQKDLLFHAGVFASYTDFKNPTIRNNYEHREERNVGGRTELQYHRTIHALQTKSIVGGEYQFFRSPISAYDNAQGKTGPLQTTDKLQSRGGLFFVQTEIDLPKSFYLTLGGSLNFLHYSFARSYPSPSLRQERNFTPTFFPRIALLKKFSSKLSVFTNVSRGFSPPSLAEVRPSTDTYNNTLNAERGISTEVGLRGQASRTKLRYELVAYTFTLKETIVLQRDANDADYFINAGTTQQQGIEATVGWATSLEKRLQLNAWLSYSLNAYYFDNYVQDAVDYSGNRLTGIAPNVAVLGFDFATKGFYLNSTIQYTDHIPLNDANSTYARYYWLLGAKAGFKKMIKKAYCDFYLGVDNALDETYSLGNDLNAAGGRYFNAAPERNFYLGITVKMEIKKK